MNTCTQTNETKPKTVKFVFMIDKEVEILAKQCISHLKPSDTSPSRMTGAFEFSVNRGQSKR